MNLDLGSFAFGSSLKSGSGTPSWGTALGQSKPDYKFTYLGVEPIIIGMVYCSVPLKTISLPLGKGGHIYNASELEECQLAALFRKVYINGTKVNYPFIIVLVKENSDSHKGRKSIKYSDKNSYKFGGANYSNQEFIRQARTTLGLENDACWFIYNLEVYNQDELHMSAVVVDEKNSVEYENSSKRSDIWNSLIPDANDYQYNENVVSFDPSKNLQRILYGAPGTGKSHETEGEIEEIYPEPEERKKNVFRTTFHPDSDYSTFVGCYKPIKNKKEKIVGKEELINKCKEYATREGYNNQNLTQFGYDYSLSLQKIVKDIPSFTYSALLSEAGVTDTSASSYITAGIELFNKTAKNCASITYDFIPQAFTKSFIRAYELLEEKKPVFLVIEEINRGNCAQIFGDLFQLLDRDYNGYSKYAIKPDTDLENYLVENLGDKYDVEEGMKLPPNFYIWATMNTSDQSLFPIDSAFKRRWCMKYVPINPYKENWAIEVGSRLFSWTSFLKKINFEISDTTKSEDKKLGFYFCKADKKAKDSDDKPTIITLENFTSKVLFYIYNDVFKDYGHEREFFKDKENGQNKIEFENFYDYNGEIKAESVEKLLVNLDVDVFDNSEADDNEEQDEDTNNSHHNYLKSVTFDDEVFSSDELKKFDVYIKSLQKIGLDKVVPIIEKSKYKRLNCPLASKQQYDAISQSKSFSYVEIDGYQFVKGVSDDTLINILNEIKSVLNLSFSIQINN